MAEQARDGFQRGVVTGLIGMGLTGLTRGRLNLRGKPMPPHRRIPTVEEYYCGRIPAEEIARLRKECAAKAVSLHGALMDRAGWPAIPLDGKLLVSHQDALLMGGKVQAPAGYADHVVFLHPAVCQQCTVRICIDACSGQAITPGPGWRARVRTGEMRLLRRMFVELLAAAPRRPGEGQHRVPRRRRRPALGGELTRK